MPIYRNIELSKFRYLSYPIERVAVAVVRNPRGFLRASPEDIEIWNFSSFRCCRILRSVLLWPSFKTLEGSCGHHWRTAAGGRGKFFRRMLRVGCTYFITNFQGRQPSVLHEDPHWESSMKKGQLDEQSLRPRYLTNVVVNIKYIYICVCIYFEVAAIQVILTSFAIRQCAALVSTVKKVWRKQSKIQITNTLRWGAPLVGNTLAETCDPYDSSCPLWIISEDRCWRLRETAGGGSVLRRLGPFGYLRVSYPR